MEWAFMGGWKDGEMLEWGKLIETTSLFGSLKQTDNVNNHKAKTPLLMHVYFLKQTMKHPSFLDLLIALKSKQTCKMS